MNEQQLNLEYGLPPAYSLNDIELVCLPDPPLPTTLPPSLKKDKRKSSARRKNAKLKRQYKATMSYKNKKSTMIITSKEVFDNTRNHAIQNSSKNDIQMCLTVVNNWLEIPKDPCKPKGVLHDNDKQTEHYFWYSMYILIHFNVIKNNNCCNGFIEEYY